MAYSASKGDANKNATSKADAKDDADKTQANPDSTWGASEKVKADWASRYGNNPDSDDADS